MQNLTGQSIGRYHILEKLGEGGMAVVYKAFDTRLNCDVAIKIIRTEKITPEASPVVLKRFENEARKTARLTHPNIVPVTDYGEHEGTPYLVMKYIPGGTLKLFTGNPIPYQKAIQLLLPIADALEYAHSNGIIHRDVKPANILITESGVPMLSDFGVAKIIEFQEETLDHLTISGVGIGTPEYMSPEQAAGKQVDGRADIYAMGIVLYELITGRKPFLADTPLAVIIKQTTDPLPRPRQFVPDLPERMEQILFKALAKKPDERFANFAEFKQWLLDADKPMEKPTPVTSSVQLAEKPEVPLNAHPKKKVAWLWGLIPLLLIAGVVTAWLLQPNKTAPPPVATVQSTAVLLAVDTATPEPTVEATPTAEPTPDQSIMFSNPYAGPIPPGAVFRLGKGTIIDSDLSPDGKVLVVATSLGLYVYDTDSLKLMDYFPIENEVLSLKFSPINPLFVTTDFEGQVSFWNLTDQKPYQTVQVTRKEISTISFSNDGNSLIIGSSDQTLRFLNTTSGITDKTLALDSKSPISCDIHPIEGLLACLYDDNSIDIVNIVTDEIKPTGISKRGFADVINPTLRYIEDGRRLYLYDGFDQVVFETGGYQELSSSINIKDSLISKDQSYYVRVKVCGELIITENKTGNNHIFQLPYGCSISNDNNYKKLLFTPTSSKLFIIQSYGISSIDLINSYRQEWIEGFELYDNVFYKNTSNTLITRSILNTRDNNPPSLFDSSFERSQDLENPLSGVDVNTNEFPQIYTQTDDGSILIGNLSEMESYGANYIYSWDLNTGNYIKRMAAGTPMAISHDKQKIVVGQNKSIKIYYYEQSSLINELPSESETCSGIAIFSPDDLYLVTSGSNKLCVWDTSSNSLVKSILRPSLITNMVFTKDGKTLLIGELDGTISIWDSNTWVIRDELIDFSTQITDMEISNNGILLAVSALGSPIRIYETNQFSNYMIIPTDKAISTLSFSGDDKLVVAFSMNGPYCSLDVEYYFQENRGYIWDLSTCTGTAIIYHTSN
jgi:serine/threonine protein kinase